MTENEKVKTETAAFQGEAGAFSERAARLILGERAELVGCKTFRQVFERVASGVVGLGVVPLENTITGPVHPNLDLLVEYGLYIVGEVKLRVEHLLIANRGVRLEQIVEVYAHPQAALQCEPFLRQSGWSIRIDYDTAGSVRRLKEEGRRDAAAIAGRAALELHGLEVLSEGIESTPHNHTRFALLSREPRVGADADKTSIVFTTRHRPGALVEALDLFRRRRVNLTRLESRPIPERPWHYQFHVDLEGSPAEPEVAAALGDLENQAAEYRWLGSYRAG